MTKTKKRVRKRFSGKGGSRTKKMAIDPKDNRVNRVNRVKKAQVKTKKKPGDNYRKKTKQSGGIVAPILAGVGLSVGAGLAYAGYKIMNLIRDKSVIMAILSRPMMHYLPKVKVTETKEFMNQYIN